MSFSCRTTMVLFFLCCHSIFAAANAPLAVHTAASGEQVRVVAQASVCQLRVQIFSPSGDALFDSAWQDGNVLDWSMESSTQPLAGGPYRCLVTVKDLDGTVRESEATLVAQNGRISVQPVEGDTANPKITLLTHDGAQGSVVSTYGDLTFRLGNVLTGEDTERMRLTAKGLEVQGLIRATKGIEFADGSILASAEGLQSSEGARSEVRPAPRPRITYEEMARAFPAPRVDKTPATNAADYQFKADSAGVHIGTTGTYGLDVAGNVTIGRNLKLADTSNSSVGVLTIGNVPFLHGHTVASQNGGDNTFVGRYAGNFSGTGVSNTGVGGEALVSVSSGNSNTATGSSALTNLTTGFSNTANGAYSMNSLTTGDFNSAFGMSSMYASDLGSSNTAIGAQALYHNNASFNTALGVGALFTNDTSDANTAIGYRALFNNTGTLNIAIGSQSGSNLTTGCCNVNISNGGVAGESNTIRIGNGNQTRAFITGIRGVTTGAANAISVVIDSNGQLGTLSSSRRYKFDIQDAGDATDGLMRLRPVTFRYLAHGNNASLQYGLIAEEVAEIYPELVARNADGEVETVMYQFLAPMLLNEVQKQRHHIEEQDQTIEELRETLAAVGRRLQALEVQAGRRH